MRLLQPLAQAQKLEPYKRILGVLVQRNVISISVSTPYLQLAEPVGTICMASKRIPSKSMELLIGRENMIGGLLVGVETGTGVPEKEIRHVRGGAPCLFETDAHSWY